MRLPVRVLPRIRARSPFTVTKIPASSVERSRPEPVTTIPSMPTSGASTVITPPRSATVDDRAGDAAQGEGPVDEHRTLVTAGHEEQRATRGRGVHRVLQRAPAGRHRRRARRLHGEDEQRRERCCPPPPPREAGRHGNGPRGAGRGAAPDPGRGGMGAMRHGRPPRHAGRGSTSIRPRISMCRAWQNHWQ